MPLYEYKCEKCHKVFEVLQSITAEPLQKCMVCDGKVEKLLSVSSFQFKGSGFYITDYKSKGSPSTSTTETKSTAVESKSSTNAPTN